MEQLHRLSGKPAQINDRGQPTGQESAQNKRPPEAQARPVAELRNGRSVAPWLTDGQHRTEVLRRFLTPAVVGLSGSQDTNACGEPSSERGAALTAALLKPRRRGSTS